MFEEVGMLTCCILKKDKCAMHEMSLENYINCSILGSIFDERDCERIGNKFLTHRAYMSVRLLPLQLCPLSLSLQRTSWMRCRG